MPVQIDLNGFRLESYANGWTLGKLRVRQSGESAGEDYLAEQTYYPTLTSVLNALTERALRESDAESLEELRAELDRVQAEIMRLVKVDVQESTSRRRRRGQNV